MTWGTYAYICKLCDHRVAIHTSPRGDDPFSCKLCGCEITDDSPMRSLTKPQYRDYKQTHPEDTGWLSPDPRWED